MVKIETRIQVRAGNRIEIELNRIQGGAELRTGSSRRARSILHFQFPHLEGWMVAGVAQREPEYKHLYLTPLLECKQLVLSPKSLQQIACLLLCADGTRNRACNIDL